MRRLLSVVLAVSSLAAAALVVVPASAAGVCSDPPSSGVNWSGCDLSGVDLTSVDLSGADLSGANLTGAFVDSSDLSGANLTGANLTDAIFVDVLLDIADFTGATVQDLTITGSDLTLVTSGSLVGTPLELPTGWGLRDAAFAYKCDLLPGPGVDWSGCSGKSGADYSGVDFSNANLSSVDLSGSDFTGANLTAANLDGADLSGATLTNADLSNASVTNASLASAVLDGADLRGADLTGSDVASAVLADATLGSDSGLTPDASYYYIAELISGSLSGVPASLPAGWSLTGGALVWHCDLDPAPGVDWSTCAKVGVDFTGVDLSSMDLSGAYLRGSDFTGADLSGSDLTGAVLAYSTLVNATVTGADFTGVNALCATVADLVGTPVVALPAVTCPSGNPAPEPPAAVQDSTVPSSWYDPPAAGPHDDGVFTLEEVFASELDQARGVIVPVKPSTPMRSLWSQPSSGGTRTSVVVVSPKALRAAASLTAPDGTVTVGLRLLCLGSECYVKAPSTSWFKLAKGSVTVVSSLAPVAALDPSSSTLTVDGQSVTVDGQVVASVTPVTVPLRWSRPRNVADERVSARFVVNVATGQFSGSLL